MLNKRENRVMGVLYEECKDKNSALISPADIARLAGGEMTAAQAEKIAADLAMDGYFDLVYSDRRGETVLCITLSEKGRAFRRMALVAKRNLVYRLGLTVAFAVVSFLIGLLLKALF